MIKTATAPRAAPAAAAVSAHPAGATRLSARERLLTAADELFYEGGINLVGIDRIIEHAGVAKASLYDCFGSKEELIRCYLQGRGERRRTRIQERIAQFQSARDKILSVFDLLSQSVAQPNYRGCALLRAGAEAGAGSTIKGACDESRAWLRTEFTDLARATGSPDPELLGRQLVLLYDGATAMAHVDRDLEAPQAARALAAQLLPAPASAPALRRRHAG